MVKARENRVMCFFACCFLCVCACTWHCIRSYMGRCPTL